MANATLNVNVKVNGLDAAEALIGAHAVIESHRARIAELEANPASTHVITPTAGQMVYMHQLEQKIAALEAELAATRWQPIETAPKDESYVLVRVKWCDEPCVARYLNGRWHPSTEHVDAEGGWEGAVVVSRLNSDDVYQWAPLPAEPATPERQAEPELVVERSEVCR